MASNAKLLVEFPSGTAVEYTVNWTGMYIEGVDCEPAEELFFSDKFHDEWLQDGAPDMTVITKPDEHGRRFFSRVNFEQETGDLYSTRNLDLLIPQNPRGM